MLQMLNIVHLINIKKKNNCFVSFQIQLQGTKGITIQMEFAEIVREKLWHALETVAIILNS